MGGPGLYEIPGFGDVPLDFRVRLLENSSAPAVMGSKAVGEPPLFLGSSVYFAAKEAIAAARLDRVAETSGGKASSDAVSGEYLRIDSPATAERIRMACLDFINVEGRTTAWHAR